MSLEFAASFLREHGFSLPAEIASAHQWCLDQAKQGLLDAQCVMSTLCWSGMTGNQNQQLGLEWCEAAAANGSLDAKSAFAKYLISGIAGPKDPERGARMLHDLVNTEHHLPSMVSLALLMMSGESDAIPVDEEGAFDLLLGPAQAGHSLSQCLVGAELTARPAESSKLAGAKWIQLAADGGFSMAHEYLAKFYQNGECGFPVDTEKAALHAAIAKNQSNSEPGFLT